MWTQSHENQRQRLLDRQVAKLAEVMELFKLTGDFHGDECQDAWVQLLDLERQEAVLMVAAREWPSEILKEYATC